MNIRSFLILSFKENCHSSSDVRPTKARAQSYMRREIGDNFLLEIMPTTGLPPDFWYCRCINQGWYYQTSHCPLMLPEGRPQNAATWWRNLCVQIFHASELLIKHNSGKSVYFLLISGYQGYHRSSRRHTSTRHELKWPRNGMDFWRIF